MIRPRTMIADAFAASGIAAGAAAQPAPGTHRIGVINVGGAAPSAVNHAAFRGALAALGYAEGRKRLVDDRAAEELGITIPPAILQRADEVIE